MPSFEPGSPFLQATRIGPPPNNGFHIATLNDPQPGRSGDRLRHDRTTKKGKQRSQDPYETGIEKSGVMPVTSVDPGSPQSYVSPLRDSNPSDGDHTLRGRLYRGPIPSSPYLLTREGGTDWHEGAS
jgi:hypothetical protein